MQAHHPHCPPGLRSALGLGLALVAFGLLRAVASSAAIDGAGWTSPQRRPDEVLVAVLAWLGMALAGWLALGSGLALLSTLPGALGRWCGSLAERLTPLLVRRVLTVALGTSTVSLVLPPAAVVGMAAAPVPVGPAVPAKPGGDATPARQVQVGPDAAAVPGASDLPRAASIPGPGYGVTADEGPGYHPTPESSSRARAVTPGATPGFRPTRPVRAHDGAGTSLLAPAPRPGMAALDTVTVRRGDSLWSIAERHLGSSASDAEVARSWPLWFAANRAVIGDDPQLIQPGMQLVPPREGDPR